MGHAVDVKAYRNNSQSYTVTGVWEKLPRNSVTQFRGTEYKMMLSEVGTWDFSERGYHRIQTAHDRIAAQPGVEAASVSWEVPQVGTGVGGTELRRPEWPVSRTLRAEQYRVDAHFDERYDLTVAEGRFF